MSSTVVLEAKIGIYGKPYFVKVGHDPHFGPANEDQQLISLGREQETDNPVEWRIFKRLLKDRPSLIKQAENAIRRERERLKKKRTASIVKGFPKKLPPYSG